MSYRKRVQARMFAGLQGSERVVLLIVTRPGGEWDPADVLAFNEDSPRRLKALLRRLRRESVEGAYFWTAELQRNGSVHFNVLVRGLPFVPVETLREWVTSSGFGPRFSVKLQRLEGVEGVSYDGVGKAGAYITKAVAYIAKGAPEWMSRRNLYGYSRNWAPAYVDQSVARLTVDMGPVEGFPGSTLRRAFVGSRRQLREAGLPLPPAGEMFRTEADAFGTWRRARAAAADALRGSLLQVEAAKRSESSPEAAVGPFPPHSPITNP